MKVDDNRSDMSRKVTLVQRRRDIIDKRRKDQSSRRAASAVCPARSTNRCKDNQVAALSKPRVEIIKAPPSVRSITPSKVEIADQTTPNSLLLNAQKGKLASALRASAMRMKNGITKVS